MENSEQNKTADNAAETDNKPQPRKPRFTVHLPHGHWSTTQGDGQVIFEGPVVPR